MSELGDGMAYPWTRLLLSSGSVEIGLHPAESWNEGVTSKRYKRKKINLASVTTRIGGWTISGEPEAAKEIYHGLSLLGFFDGMPVRAIERGASGNRGPRLFIYIDKLA
jgi:hypothetical protein